MLVFVCLDFFVLSWSRNNSKTIVRVLSVLLSLLLHFTWYARSISIPSNYSFCANTYWTFSLQSFHVSPFVSLIPSILISFLRDLSSKSVTLPWTYVGFIWFSILFSTLPTFSSKLFCVNSGIFPRHWFHFSTHVFFASLVWSYH